LLAFIFNKKLEIELQLEFNLLLESTILLYFLQFILVALLELKKEIKTILKKFYTIVIRRIK